VHSDHHYAQLTKHGMPSSQLPLCKATCAATAILAAPSPANNPQGNADQMTGSATNRCITWPLQGHIVHRHIGEGKRGRERESHIICSTTSIDPAPEPRRPMCFEYCSPHSLRASSLTHIALFSYVPLLPAIQQYQQLHQGVLGLQLDGFTEGCRHAHL
jgi:hypothetical protein